MTAAAIVGLVLGILVVVALGLAIGLGPFLRKGKRARQQLEEELRSEPALRGPESADYRGTTSRVAYFVPDPDGWIGAIRQAAQLR